MDEVKGKDGRRQIERPAEWRWFSAYQNEDGELIEPEDRRDYHIIEERDIDPNGVFFN